MLRTAIIKPNFRRIAKSSLSVRKNIYPEEYLILNNKSMTSDISR